MRVAKRNVAVVRIYLGAMGTTWGTARCGLNRIELLVANLKVRELFLRPAAGADGHADEQLVSIAALVNADLATTYSDE